MRSVRCSGRLLEGVSAWGVCPGVSAQGGKGCPPDDSLLVVHFYSGWDRDCL